MDTTFNPLEAFYKPRKPLDLAYLIFPLLLLIWIWLVTF
jgi:hypothetical protein